MINYGIEISEGTRISNLTVDVGSFFPLEPNPGELFFKTPENLLHVFDGSVWNPVGGDLSSLYLPITGGTLTGNLTVNGTMTTINSSTVDVRDPIISIGDSTLTVNDGKDRGIEFKYTVGATPKTGFFGFDNTTGNFTFIPDATNVGESFSGSKGYIDAYINYTNISNTPTTLSGFGITDAAPLSHVGSGGTAHSNATTSVAGFMSASDKVKLDGISSGANNYTLPVATAGSLGGIKKGNGLTILGDGTLSTDVSSVNGMIGDITISYVPYANALQTARTIQATGDASWLVTFDGSMAVSSPLTLSNTGVIPGTYTSITVDSKGRTTFGSTPSTLAGYGITDAQPLSNDLTSISELTETIGFLKKNGTNNWIIDNSTYLTSNQVITLTGDVSGNGTTSINVSLSNTGVTAGTYKSVTVDTKGRVVYATNPTTLSGFGITDAAPLSHVGSGGTAHSNATTSVAGFMSASDKAKLDGISSGANNYTLPIATQTTLGGVKDGSGVSIAGDGTLSADVTSVNGLTGAVSITSVTGNAGTATTLQNSRTISATGDISWTVTFDGSANVSSIALLSNTGITPGTYKSVTVDAKGRISSGSNPTTLAGYGITDATPLSHVGSGGSAHALATTTTAGFMSASDKTKLDSVSSGAAVLSVAGKIGEVTLTPSDVFLSNVENKSSATIRSEITSSNVTTALGFIPENTSNKNVANGYAGLDSTGKLSTAVLPAIAITDTYVVTSQASMLALNAQTGDVAVRTDLSKSFILRGSSASTLADWQELLAPLAAVSSVNGLTGDVSITTITGNAGTATTLQNSRTISATGDASWSVNFDGSTNVSSVLTLSNSGATAGTYKSVTVDVKGRVTAGTNPTTLSGFGITDAAPLSHVGSGGTAHSNATTSVAGFMSASDKAKLDGISTGANNYTLPVATVTTLGGVKDGPGVSVAVDGTLSADVTSVNGLTGAVSITTITGNAGTATTLQNSRTISATGDASWSVNFDGSTNASSVLTLSNTGVTAGTYTSVTVDAKGRVTAGSTIGSSTIISALGYTPSRTSSSNETNSVTFADTRAVNDTPTSRNAGVFFDFKQNTTNGLSDGGTYNTQLTLRGYGSSTDITGANMYQLAFTDNGNMWLRKYSSATTWSSWYKFWNQNNDGAGSGLDADLLDNQNGTYYLDWTNFTNKPTTLSGYGITDAQPLDADLTAIGALSGTTGLLRKTAANTWVLDTASYLTSNQTITLSGDVSGTGTTSITTTLSPSGVSAGTYGSATVIPQITFDSKGRAVAASNIAVTPTWSSITGKPTTLSGYGITDAQPLDGDLTAISSLTGTSGLLKKTAADTWILDTTSYLTSNQTITLSGDATGSGSTAISLTLSNSGVTAGTYNNSSTTVTPLVVDAKGRITATNSPITITPAWSSITSKPTTIAGYGITDGVTLSGTQYLSNKYFVDSFTYFIDGSDTSKVLQFELSNITPATTRTLTIPNVNGTLITSGDTSTVTNTMLAGSIANNKLSNSSITINSSSVSLGGSVTVTANTPYAITFNNSGLGATSGTTFNGNALTTISHNTIGALGLSGGTLTGDLYINSISSEYDIGWNFTGRNVYLYGRDSDDRVGLYDSVLGSNRWYTDTSGNFIASGDVTAFSDRKLKKDLTKIDNALNKIERLTGYTFTRIDTEQRQMGLIAQDVLEVAPEAVRSSDDVLSVAYGNLMGLVVEAIKELKKEIEDLKRKM